MMASRRIQMTRGSMLDDRIAIASYSTRRTSSVPEQVVKQDHRFDSIIRSAIRYIATVNEIKEHPEHKIDMAISTAGIGSIVKIIVPSGPRGDNSEAVVPQEGDVIASRATYRVIGNATTSSTTALDNCGGECEACTGPDDECETPDTDCVLHNPGQGEDPYYVCVDAGECF